CTLDVLMHLPRSVFSHRQQELFTWLLKVNNVDDVPSVSSMMELNSMLQKLCGIESIPYNGALGHKYYEMSNPKQGKRWLEEMLAQQTTPMARIGTADYFIYEPAMLTDGTCCMPFRWFLRGKILFAKCWSMESVTTEHAESWRVVQRESEVSQDKFLKNLTDLKTDFHRHDVMDLANGIISEWTLTNPVEGNPWRERAKGSCVYAFPIWLPSGLQSSIYSWDIKLMFTRAAQKDGIWAWDCELNELVLMIPAVLALLGDNPMQSEFACHIGLRGKFFCRACWVKGSDNAGENDGDDQTTAVRGDGNDSDAERQGGSDAVSDAGSDKSQQSVEIEDGAVLTAASSSKRAQETPGDVESTPEPSKATAAGKKKSRRKRVKESLDQILQRAKSVRHTGQYYAGNAKWTKAVLKEKRNCLYC
ncbi:hypothetical protein B0H11DRAFT_1728235, partial [Mycena galericulata]